MKLSALLVPVLVLFSLSAAFAATPLQPSTSTTPQKQGITTQKPDALQMQQQIPPKAVNTQPLGGIQVQGLKITGIAPSQPEVVSKPDGTATVDVIVSGTGVAVVACTVMVMAGDGSNAAIPIAPQSGFPKTVQFTFKKPSKYSLRAYFMSGAGCTGSAESWATVNPYPDYPCSRYPGFRKQGLVNGYVCYPEMAPLNNFNPADFNCPQGTTFKNIGGYLLGCFTPEFLNMLCGCQ